MSMAMAAFVPNVPNPKPVTGQRKSQSNSQWHLAFLAQLGFLQLFLVVSSVLNVRFNSPGDPHDDGLIQSLSYLSEARRCVYCKRTLALYHPETGPVPFCPGNHGGCRICTFPQLTTSSAVPGKRKASLAHCPLPPQL